MPREHVREHSRVDGRLGGGQRLALLFNPEAESLPFTLVNGPWKLLLDSSGELPEGAVAPGLPLNLSAHSLVLLAALENA